MIGAFFKPAALGAIALLVGCASLPPPQDHVARNGLLIYERPNGAFEIVARPGTAGPAYFCAAGDFARVRLGARATDRVIMVRPDGPSGNIPGARSAIFEVGPPGPRTQALISTVPMRQAGASLPVASAQALCRPDRNSPHTIS
ncbi:hypothetical protein ACVDG3_04600 [Meridianimarinicoccus sp. RP-17]|uniref:hypothetical protein n=1 Tax=Meridianimarinicoccus zhengii TaxID=2056810 RepID=UPI000DAD41CC|nr:hypothetical protein [Phycocomes zhengii]